MIEIYFSVDIEADGPIPGQNSMVALGVVAFSENGDVLDRFGLNFCTLEGAVQDPDTMKWWARNQDAWNNFQDYKCNPKTGMKIFYDWVLRLSAIHDANPVFVGYPVAGDFMFVYWYLMKFVGHSPFSYSALDIKTMAMIALKKPYRASTKRNMLEKWLNPALKHKHMPLDDALEQGHLFFAIKRELYG